MAYIRLLRATRCKNPICTACATVELMNGTESLGRYCADCGRVALQQHTAYAILAGDRPSPAPLPRDAGRLRLAEEEG